MQIDLDPTMIGMRYPYEVNLVGDAAATLQRADPAAGAQGGPLLAGRASRPTSPAGGRPWPWRPPVEADPINPMQLFAELSPRLPDDAIVTADSGSSANWYARHLRFRGGMRGSLSGNLATMGPGVPYGIGAKFGSPGPAGDRVRRRRRDADERHRRADHRQRSTGSSGPTRG